MPYSRLARWRSDTSAAMRHRLAREAAARAQVAHALAQRHQQRILRLLGDGVALGTVRVPLSSAATSPASARSFMQFLVRSPGLCALRVNTIHALYCLTLMCLGAYCSGTRKILHAQSIACKVVPKFEPMSDSSTPAMSKEAFHQLDRRPDRPDRRPPARRHARPAGSTPRTAPAAPSFEQLQARPASAASPKAGCATAKAAASGTAASSRPKTRCTASRSTWST